MTEKQLFLVIGAGRSGTTAVAKILDTADNAVVTIESDPKLCIAARDRYHNTLPYPGEFIAKSIAKKIESYAGDAEIYGDKNPNYVFFSEEIYRCFNCKFVFVIRDGRDVVRSAVDFDRYRTPNYHRYEDEPDSAVTQPEQDFWDYARMRPLPHSPDYQNWRSYTKFEKFCWLWAHFNELLLEQSKKIPPTHFRFLNMTRATLTDIKDIFAFLGLKPFKAQVVDRLLNSKINTVNNKDKNLQPFPGWRDWDEGLKEIFKKHAYEMMVKLNFFNPGTPLHQYWVVKDDQGKG